MSIKRITIMDNESYLRQVSEDIDFATDNIQDYIDVLEEYCGENKCFAMASVQLGIPKRLIYIRNTTLDNSNYDNTDYNERQIIINPIIKQIKGLTMYWENCASCGDNMGLVYRPYSAEVEYFDELGIFHNRVFEGFETTVFFHEYDHLNGVLHMDKSEEILKYNAKQRREFRKSHPYEIISKDCEFTNKNQVKEFIKTKCEM